jgi:hypothetical protein
MRRLIYEYRCDERLKSNHDWFKIFSEMMFPVTQSFSIPEPASTLLRFCVIKARQVPGCSLSHCTRSLPFLPLPLFVPCVPVSSEGQGAGCVREANKAKTSRDCDCCASRPYQQRLSCLTVSEVSSMAVAMHQAKNMKCRPAQILVCQTGSCVRQGLAVELEQGGLCWRLKNGLLASLSALSCSWRARVAKEIVVKPPAHLLFLIQIKKKGEKRRRNFLMFLHWNHLNSSWNLPWDSKYRPLHLSKVCVCK